MNITNGPQRIGNVNYDPDSGYHSIDSVQTMEGHRMAGAVLDSLCLMGAWCDMFQDVMTRLCAPEPTVTIPLKEYKRLKAGYGIGAMERGQLAAQWQGAMGQGILGQLGALVPKR